jgi:hypothetical protein
MTSVIDPLTFPVIDVPAIWCPPETKTRTAHPVLELERQAQANLILSADIIESVIRLIFGEAEIEKVMEPPEGYDPDVQGDWDESVATYAFKRPILKIEEERDEQHLLLVYSMKELGTYRVALTETSFSITKEH